jgi:hypothetical protein
VIAALLLALLSVQDAVPEGEEVVITATLGRTTMLFDKGADGKLRNCRVMKSSGSVKRDADACQATPVCYARTLDDTPDCVAFAVIDRGVPGLAAAGASGAGSATPVYNLSALARPQPRAPGVAGPLSLPAEDEPSDQLVKLPPVPQAPSSGPAVKVSVSNQPAKQDD